jgi:NAD(P)-dependent dehydrogenase (short-subunit alcohol dehydrogenase family)
MDFAGQNVLIFGSTSGIGLATAIRFAQMGARVIACGRYPEKFERAKAQLSVLGDKINNVMYHQCDVRLEQQVKDTIEYIVNSTGPISVFFNNAGVYPRTEGKISNMNYASSFANGSLVYSLGPVCLPGQTTGLSNMCESPIATIGMGTFYCLKWEMVYAQYVAHSVSIVNTASEAGMEAFPDSPLYAASKAMVISLTKSFAKMVAPSGRIRVNCVSPGPIETPLLADTGKEMMDIFAQQVPMKRNGKPDEVASVVLFLSNPMWSSYVTGANYTVDGGSTT